MIRRIVLTRGREELRTAWAARSFAAAGTVLASAVGVRGMSFDENYHPVRVPGESSLRLSRPRSLGFDYRSLHDANRRGAAYAVRAEFEDEEAVERMKAERGEEVVGVFADPKIQPCANYCGDPAVGKAADVAARLGVPALRKAGLTGKGVRVVVMDTGVDGKKVKVAGGWGPVLGYVPGSTAAAFDSDAAHGTMCAYDVLIAAPDAHILDYALLQSAGPGWTAFLSDALLAYGELLKLMQDEPGPLVVNNSWVMYDRSEDAPIGSPENYSANPEHPFNQMMATVTEAGADVCFAAGNCGADCPDGRCGKFDVGPGGSIHGANSHPDVVTVAAVTVDGRRLGYSSQGPAGLSKRKPNLAGYSHFKGSGVYGADSGTSAASPVVAGVIAALRQKADPTKLPPASMLGLLQRTCKDLGAVGWDYDLGYGVVDAAAALKALTTKPTTKPTKKATTKPTKKPTKKATKKAAKKSKKVTA